MKIMTCYSVKIKEYRTIFKNTIVVYRHAVDFFIDVCIEEWDSIEPISYSTDRMTFIERLSHKTKGNSNPKYDFDTVFPKMPTYLRRAAINEALGKVSSYKSNLALWEASDTDTRGAEPTIPKVGYDYPSLYKDNMFVQTDKYEAKIKVFRNNTWDWIIVKLRKSDIDYINRRCTSRKKCCPTLRKRGKCWYLDFPFEEIQILTDTPVKDQLIIAVDLGLNSSAVCTAMNSKGTVYGRHFCNLSSEKDSLNHAINRIKKAHQHNNKKTPRLWVKAKGINVSALFRGISKKKSPGCHT